MRSIFLLFKESSAILFILFLSSFQFQVALHPRISPSSSGSGSVFLFFCAWNSVVLLGRRMQRPAAPSWTGMWWIPLLSDLGVGKAQERRKCSIVCHVFFFLALVVESFTAGYFKSKIRNVCYGISIFPSRIYLRTVIFCSGFFSFIYRIQGPFKALRALSTEAFWEARSLL